MQTENLLPFPSSQVEITDNGYIIIPRWLLIWIILLLTLIISIFVIKCLFY